MFCRSNKYPHNHPHNCWYQHSSHQYTLVLEIDYRGYHGRRTKDIWEDQKAGKPKDIIGECKNICSQPLFLSRVRIVYFGNWLRRSKHKISNSCLLNVSNLHDFLGDQNWFLGPDYNHYCYHQTSRCLMMMRKLNICTLPSSCLNCATFHPPSRLPLSHYPMKPFNYCWSISQLCENLSEPFGKGSLRRKPKDGTQLFSTERLFHQISMGKWPFKV